MAILVEKALSGGEALPRLYAVVRAPHTGISAATPATVPGVTQPIRMQPQR